MLKKHIKLLLLLLIVSLLSFGIYKFFGDSNILVKLSQITSNSAPVENHSSHWNIWATTSLVLLLINFLVIAVTFKILNWRKSVSNGMMAVVPNMLLSDVKLVTDSQSKLIQWLQQNINQITKLLKDNSESINILKNELALKETEIDSLKDGQLKNEKNKFINKVVKLHTFFITLTKQIEKNEIDAKQALNVLSEELSEIFNEFDIYLINPEKHSLVQNIVNEGFTIKEVIKTQTKEKDSTVEKVLDFGYYAKTPEGKIRIIKPATLVINKFGE